MLVGRGGRDGEKEGREEGKDTSPPTPPASSDLNLGQVTSVRVGWCVALLLVLTLWCVCGGGVDVGLCLWVVLLWCMFVGGVDVCVCVC